MLSSSASCAMVPTLHRVRQAAAAGHRVAGRAPQRRQAREQHEQHRMIGAPSSAIQPAVRAACSSGGLPTGMCALTSAVSRPSSASSIAKAVSSDCEIEEVREHREEAQEEDHEGVAPRAQLQRLERQQDHDQRDAGVAARAACGGSTQVATSVTRQQADAATICRASGLACTASVPRHSSTTAASALHHQGRLATCGSSTQPMTASRNSVSRASRGSALEAGASA